MNSLKISLISLCVLGMVCACTSEKETYFTLESSAQDSLFTNINLFNSVSKQGIDFKGGQSLQQDLDSVALMNLDGRSDNGYFWTQVFVTPGDNISFRTTTDKDGYYQVLFEGENAAHYNYYLKKNQAIYTEVPDILFDKTINLEDYKKQLQKYRKEETDFLQEYEQKYSVSDDFKNYAKSEIDNFYAFKLYQAVYLNKCKTLPDRFLDDAEITQNPLSYYAKMALNFKYVYLLSGNNLENGYKIILKEVHPKFRNELIDILVKWFSGIGDTSYKTNYLNVCNHIKKSSKDSTLLATVKEYESYYDLSGKMLPDSLLQNQLQAYDEKQSISLQQMLDKYQGLSVMIDFWSSGCKPCRHVNRTMDHSYFVEKNIAVVSISLDDSENAWVQAVIDDNISNHNQYRVIDYKKWDALKINSIPRFILLNKKHEIALLSAPKPIDCTEYELKNYIESHADDFVATIKPIVQKPSNRVISANTSIKNNTRLPKKEVIYHDNFGTFSSPTTYTDAWGNLRKPAQNWQTKYSPYTIPHHTIVFGSPDDGSYAIGTLKEDVMWDNTRGSMDVDASGNPNGAVLCINVAKNYQGEIYRKQINSLKSNVVLNFEVSIANASYAYRSIPPQVAVQIEDIHGKVLGVAQSALTSSSKGWQKVEIQVPPIPDTSVVVCVISNGTGWENGCDLLMDDVIFSVYN